MKPIDRVHEQLDAKGCSPYWSDGHIVSRCPVPHQQKRSLLVSPQPGDAVAITGCCPPADVLAALGLDLTDVALTDEKPTDTNDDAADLMGRLDEAASEAIATMPPQQPHLSDSFWTSRPHLQHIRQAAHSRMRSADAVLLAVLARVAAFTDYRVELPPIVSAAASINFLIALVGPSGGGKSSAMKLAALLLPVPEDLAGAFDRPLGSGEGIAEAYMGWVDDTGATGKPKKIRQQVRHHALVRVDEGQVVSDLGSRTGSTIMESIRRAAMGETLGQANASAETTRVVPEGQYRFAMAVGLQPIKAADLLGDVTGGTPQRFCWAWATDPNIPEALPDWPDPLDWDPPQEDELKRLDPRGSGRYQLKVDDIIVEEIRERAWQVATGRSEPDPLDSHADLIRLKIAALLALLDDRRTVRFEDWLAGKEVWDMSCAVRAHTLLVCAAEQERQRDEKIAMRKRAAEAEVAARRSVPERVTRYARRLGRHVQSHPNDSFTRSQLRKQLASFERDFIDAAISEAIEKNWITERDEKYRAGGWSAP